MVPSPEPGEVQTISTLVAEWREHCSSALGTVIVGDINVHHIRWLRYSIRNSTEGEKMRTFCLQHGFRQLVKEPTRGANLLDLLMTDIDDVKCKVLPAIADHSGILASLKLRVPKTETVQRLVWNYLAADWYGLRNKLYAASWSVFSRLPPDEGAEYLTSTILAAAREFIPQRELCERKATHPWMNDRVLGLLKAKHEAQGTTMVTEARDVCSRGILEEFGNYVRAERDPLSQMRSGCKRLWSKSRRLLQLLGVISSIPALKNDENAWILDAAGKADLFAKTFPAKSSLCEGEVNHFSSIDVSPCREQKPLSAVTREDAVKILECLREDSGTGPDLLPSRILKMCAEELTEAVCRLTQRILDTGRWPDAPLDSAVVQ